MSHHSGRFRPGLPPEVVAAAEQVREHVWRTALWLMLKEIKHGRTCTDTTCGGIIFPWLVENIVDREGGIAFASVVMENCADGVAEQMPPGFDVPDEPPPEPDHEPGSPLSELMNEFERVITDAERRHARKQGSNGGRSG